MNGNAARFFRLGAGFVGLLALGCALTVSAAKPSRRGIALPTDWSHSHLIFSQPRSVEQAMRLQEDPRFRQQVYRRALPLRLPPTQTEWGGISSPHLRFPVRLPPRVRSKGLWMQSLGAGANVGAVNFPAKFSFNSGVADCGSDYVVYSTGLPGSGTQASLIAYNNLYSGCGGTVPSVYWAYNTSGQILTSPVLSLDGKQIAFAQTTPGGGSLVLLKWAASTGETVASPGAPMNVFPPAGYSTCTAPCMTIIALQDPALADDTTSSVYYDYSSDTAWVGDSLGYLHKFSPVFAGPPAEVTGATWPVQLQHAPLASPVYDSGSGNVFVGDTGGYFYSVSAANGTVTQSSLLDHGTGIRSGPLVDSTAGVAYVFSSNDGSTDCSLGPCAAVYSFPAGFAAGSVGSEVAVGASVTTPNPLYEGELDSAYENSTNASGNLYVCGNTGGQPTLYQVHITSGGFLDPAVPGPVLTATTTTGCSPVTDFLNPNATGGATEFIFASAQTDGVPTACGGGGCIMNFKSTPWLALTAYTLGQEIVDSNFQLQMVIRAGTSGTSAPAWSTSLTFPANETTDGTGALKWLNLGVTTAATPAPWVANNPYAVGNFIEDTNFNIEVVTAVRRDDDSGTGTPIWRPFVGQTTPDHHVTWINAGPATGALPTAGGTSGVIIDNIVEPETSGSQIYFSTQGNQATCGTATSVGCAVQASQSALQ